ncbi:MAG TPA: PA2169 family four-helix-bundle protein [Puia sp.]|nr:PA2169 family four-helix-bundle protein [Puia sp.]
MKSKARIIEELGDLIRINGDRIAGYERASQEDIEKDPGVRNAFYKISIDSRSFVNDLHSEILRLGGSPVTHKTVAGKLYRFWLARKVDFSGSDPLSLLAALEYGEESVQAAYELALTTEMDFPANIRRLLERQLIVLQRLHEPDVF